MRFQFLRVGEDLSLPGGLLWAENIMILQMSHMMRKPAVGAVRPGKTQTSLLGYRS